MSYADNPYASFGLVAADAPTTERAQFIRKTYAHLAGAIFLFMGLEAVLLSTPLGGAITSLLWATGWGWVIVLGAFMGISFLANSWASSTTSVSTQYMGLGLYVVAQALICLPLLYIAKTNYPPEVIPVAGLLTLIVFAGLTGVVFISGADFSFLRMGLTIFGMVALGFVVCMALFGSNLGVSPILFSSLMIGFASGYILYDTSNVLHHYRIGQHVAAALALFASVALLFFYILRLVMALNRR